MRSARAATVLALLMATPAVAAAAAGTLDEARDMHRQGRLAEALRLYRRVVAERPESPEAATAHNNACVVLADLGDLRAAEAECERALGLRRRFGDERGVARTLNNLGLALQGRGRFDEAEARYGEALEINRRRGDVAAETVNRANLAALAILAGAYDAAIAHLDAVERLASAHADEAWAEEQTTVAAINRGVVLEKLGGFRQALEVYRGLLDGAVALGDRRRAQLLTNSGVIYRNLGDPATALERFGQAAALYERVGDRAGRASARLNVALALQLNLRQPEAAEEAYREALRLADEADDRIGAIEGRFYLGRLLSSRRRWDEAEELFSECLRLAVESGSAEGRWSALEGLGRVALGRGLPEAAMEPLERAIGEIESVRSSLERGRLRSGFFGDKRPVYAAAVAALARLEEREPGLGHAARALELAQRAKARDLLDALGPGSRGVTPLGAAELARLVGRGRLLEYFVALDRLLLWEVRSGTVRMFDLGDPVPVMAESRRLHAALAAGSPPPPGAVEALSRRLLGPLDESGGGLLRIAADGPLHYLPFELLHAGDAAEPLVERFAVAYLPSGSALAWLRGRAPKRSLAFAGFADPALPGGASEAFSARTLADRFRLRPLPGARRELQEVAARLRGPQRLSFGGEATEARFRETVRGGVGVLHLAAHAVVDETSARGTALVLATAGGDDGLLYPEEIAALEVPTGLTVLAACATRPGAGEEAAALTSLTGSFLAAGSSAVVATLWRVGDEATRAFMQQFYFHLGRGRRPVEALRRAKRAMRADPAWRDPSLWSGYVLVGEGERPPGRPAAGVWVWVLAVGGVAAALLGRAGLRRRRG